MKVAAILVAVLALVVMANAYQRAFYGGSFKQANGIYSPAFAAYDANSNGWREVPPPGIFEGQIVDIAPVGEEGVFAVGVFSSINNQVPSFGVAFFDGHKWCAVRHGLAQSSEQGNWDSPGMGTAVWCNNGTSCYVAGRFGFIENQPDNAPNNPVNFAHYIRDAETGEWLFDSSITEWNNPTLTGPVFTLPPNAFDGNTDLYPIPGTLQGVPADDPEYFFVGIGENPPDAYGNAFSYIFRGGRQDGGWLPYLNTGGVFSTGILRGFDVDDDSASPAVYVVSDSGSTSEMAKKSTVLLRPCTVGICAPFVTQTSEWVSLVPGTAQLSALYDVVAVNASTRYYIGAYSPGSGYDTRNVALRQDGFSSPVPLGAPFARDSTVQLVRIDLFDGDKPFVIGGFRTANLHYPADTDDFAGVVRNDIRELDSVHYVAIYENGQWNAHFGGGISPDTETGIPDINFARSITLKHNAQSNIWYFSSPYITFVHNVKAEGLAYFDDAEDLNHKNIYALFTRRITRRSTSINVAESTVYDVACETEDCAWVYAGGDFGFHGPDTLGAIAKVEVRRDNPTVVSVGGGLWATDNDIVPTDADLQFTPGYVYALRTRGDFVYAGGWFSRGKNGYVCLNNLARIHHSDSESGNWEALGGGCDDSIYDLHFWGEDLYAVGDFEKCGSNVVNYVTAYQSGEYRSLNNGLDDTAYTLEYFQGRMIVGGEFAHAGGLPVSGVAAWDGQKWRALQAACTQDCVAGDLPFYFGQLVSEPQTVHDLRASKDGTVLYARAGFSDAPGLLLAQWQYFDQGDTGKWTAKGSLVAFDFSDAPFGSAILNNGTQLVVGGILGASPSHTHQGLSIHAYSLEQENWVDNDILIAGLVEVVRSSASTLDSWLSYF